MALAAAKTPSSARESRRLKTCERILAAAIVHFAERGCEGTTLRDIAERSGVKQPLILYHFGNKEALWRAAVDEVFARMEQSLVADARERGLAFPAEGEPLEIRDREALRGLLRAFVGSVSRHPEYLRILLREASHRGPRFDWLAANHTARNYASGAALFESAQASGLLPDIPVHHLVYLLAGAMTFIFAVGADVERQTGRDPVSQEFLDGHIEALLELIGV
jgi:TetR/AcrR family transcriptional regulator